MVSKHPLDFLKQYSSVYTVTNYRSALKRFFETLYGEREPLQLLAQQYFSESRNYEEDIQAFLVDLKNYAPKTIRLMLSSIKIFLLENGVEFSQQFWRRIRRRIKGNRALTIDAPPSNEQLRKIVMHLPVHGKALYLTLSSSGMRLGEVIKLKVEDLDLDQDPAIVNIRGEHTKSGNPRITFISREAQEAVQEWLKTRGKYLEAAAGKSHLHQKDTKDPRLFPFTTNNARYIWNNALDKSGNGEVDASTNIHKIHPHTLRKFFRTKMGSVIPVDVVEALMGHEGYLTEVYRRYTMEDLAKFYKQGEQVLQVFGVDIKEISQMRDELKQDRDNLQRIVNGLTAENLELKSRISRVEVEVTEIKKIMQKLV